MKFDPRDKIDFSEYVIKHQSAGGFVLYEDPSDHKLFVALLRGNDGYYIPKGHLRYGENELEAARREIKEEINLKEPFDLVSKIGINSYSFTLDDNKKHQKDVHMYIFSVPSRYEISASSGFISASWLDFDSAIQKIKFDREYLLKARQLYYFNKKISLLKSLRDIKSITVGIPTYNGELTLLETLSSIQISLKKLPDNVKKEIFICLDHCTDNSMDVVKKFILTNKSKNEIKVFVNPGRKGKSSALNYMFYESKSQLVCFVDDDVILDNECLLNLIREFIRNKNLRYVYANWIRKPYTGKNLWNKFWHYIFGVKFDIQPYDRRSEIMRGACTVARRESFIYLPDGIYNEDQFIQYIYWPKTKEVISAIIFFSSVLSLSDYFKRFIRITAGINQLKMQFSIDRVQFCTKRLFREIDKEKIERLPLKEKSAFLFYRFVRFWVNKLVAYRLSKDRDYEWFRFKQG